ncbi:MAG: porphobilinogen synthase [Pseudobdellovibrionaceae bacterium]|nr:porphobilinogen synthase [Bdellovibrionales bacterium]USN48937.1 MAG: porphobilinogen synthase [Pseudobdellovibrionaceae bacterium]
MSGVHIRPRRLRRSEAIRGFVRETHLDVSNLVLPQFILPGKHERQPITSMPDFYRLSVDHAVTQAKEAYGLGLRGVALFPVLPQNKKDATGSESKNPQGLIPTAVKAIKDAVPEMLVITDVALDPYSSEGHDGLVREGEILNDESLEILAEMAIAQAASGADLVAPSDMMDGRIGYIRSALDQTGHRQTGVLSYAAKYASGFYGPFREALDSAPKFGDKKTYQMDPANLSEALREAELDVQQGADILMVKPGLPYLDVIASLYQHFSLPIAAYQVSGEYSMIMAAARNGWLDEKTTAVESLLALRRAGSQMIFTYFALKAANWLQK